MIYTKNLRGSCLGRSLEGAKVTVDTDAPIRSGDLIEVITRYQATGRIASMMKQLEATRDGRWWLVCMEGVTPIGKYFVPAAIHLVTAIDAQPYPPASVPLLADDLNTTANESTLRFWDDQSCAARLEWTRRGKLRGVQFPGLEAALLAGDTDWPEPFRLPPDHFPAKGNQSL
jgi:hypothetical protein